MSREDDKRLVSAFYDAFNTLDNAAFDRILDADWVNHPADPGHPNTPAGVKRGVVDFHQAFAEFHIEREVMVAEGEYVVCRITMTGRHVGDFGDWKASGEWVRFHGMDMHRVAHGKIVETWHFENFDG